MVTPLVDIGSSYHQSIKLENKSTMESLFSRNTMTSPDHTPFDSLVLNPADVLLGRGKGFYKWAGNVVYSKIISSFVPAYEAATKNKDKMRISLEIVSLIKVNGGRFVGVDTTFGPHGDPLVELYEVSDADARQKVSQVSLAHAFKSLLPTMGHCAELNVHESILTLDTKQALRHKRKLSKSRRKRSKSTSSSKARSRCFPQKADRVENQDKLLTKSTPRKQVSRVGQEQAGVMDSCSITSLLKTSPTPLKACTVRVRHHEDANVLRDSCSQDQEATSGRLVVMDSSPSSNLVCPASPPSCSSTTCSSSSSSSSASLCSIDLLELESDHNQVIDRDNSCGLQLPENMEYYHVVDTDNASEFSLLDIEDQSCLFPESTYAWRSHNACE